MRGSAKPTGCRSSGAFGPGFCRPAFEYHLRFSLDDFNPFIHPRRDTVQLVVEGTFNMQQQWMHSRTLGFDLKTVRDHESHP